MKSILNYILLALNILSVIAVLLSLLGSVLSPVQFSLPIYFTLGFPVIILVNIVFVILWAIVRRWYFLISLIALLLAYNQISIIFPIHFGSKAVVSSSKSLVIVSYNTMMNGRLLKHLPNQPNGAIEYLLSTNADIICIQEYYVKTDEKYLTPNDIDTLFKSYPYKYIKFDCDNYDSITGLATFSKYPIIKNERIKYESIFNASIYSDIVIDKDTIRVFNNHLESNRFMGSDLHVVNEITNDFDSEKLTNTTGYFLRKLKVAYPVRAVQADIIHDVISSTPYKVIVCGDFNDVPVSYSYTKVKGDLNDAYVNSGTGFGWSFNSSIYKLRLDYIFYDNNFEVQDFQIGRNKSSDHFPIKCVLNMK